MQIQIKKETKQFQTFALSYFIGKSHFEDDGAKNYLVFQSVFKYFTRRTGSNRIILGKCKALSEECIKSPATADNILAPGMILISIKIRVKLDINYLKQEKTSFNC